MSNIKGTGVPNKTIQASIGDIYTDESTGKNYKCTFAYRDGSKDTFDTQWTETNDIIEKETKPEQKVEVEDVKQNRQNNRKNYSNYSKLNK